MTQTVATHPASPVGIGSDGLVSPPPRFVSVTATADATSITLQPESAACWLQVDAAAPGFDPVGTVVSVRGTVTEVEGLDVAEAECLADAIGRVRQSETRVETIPLRDPPYPGEFDPVRAVMLNHLDVWQRRAVLERRALVSELAAADPDDAAVVARASEQRFRLPEGFLTESS